MEYDMWLDYPLHVLDQEELRNEAIQEEVDNVIESANQKQLLEWFYQADSKECVEEISRIARNRYAGEIAESIVEGECEDLNTYSEVMKLALSEQNTVYDTISDLLFRQIEKKAEEYDPY